MREITDVMLVTTANPTYLKCWNPVSEVWKTKFGVTPHLLFFDTEDHFKRSQDAGLLRDDWGEVTVMHPELPFENPSRPWEAPTLLFWMAKYFQGGPGPRIIAGIDRMPLRPAWRELLPNALDDQLVVAFSGAYRPWSGVHWADGWLDLIKNRYPYYPSEWVIGRKDTFYEMYDTEVDPFCFLARVATADLVPMFNNVAGRWGLDEAYHSQQLSLRAGSPRVSLPDGFWPRVCASCRLVYGKAFKDSDIKAGRYGSMNGGWADRGEKDPWLRKVIDAIPDYRDMGLHGREN